MYKDFRDAVLLDGDLCMTIAMEELSELIQAISKFKRGKGNKVNIAEEIADVLISLEWVKREAEIKNVEIMYWLDFKKNRIMERLEKDEFF